MSKQLNVIGLMSGTSLDGIDVALLRTDGEAVVERGPAQTYPYAEEQRSILRQSLHNAISIATRTDRPGILREAEIQITQWHLAVVQAFLAKHGLKPSEIDLIGFHGQTVLHRPDARLTVQLGDGQALARQLGIRVAYDMRAADVAAGGQGAPLVPVYHRALAANLKQRPAAFVNIGGVANISYVNGAQMLAFDTGPGNAMIDDWMRKHTGFARDEGGATALRGIPDEAAVAQFLGDPYFEKPAPKSLDRNAFAHISLGGLGLEAGAATLTAVTTRAIARSVEILPKPPATWIVCGGGRHNTAIMGALRELLPGVVTAEDRNFDGDSMEAEAWAYLAVRSLHGLPLTFPGTTGVPREISGGIIALP